MGFKLPTQTELEANKLTRSNLIRFDTNRNYMHAIATLVRTTANNNDCNRGVLNALGTQSGFCKLKSKSDTANLDMLGKMLRNSWTAEVAVRRALQSDDLIQASIVVPWSFVQMYYGLYHLFDGWLAIQSRENLTSKHHTEFLNRYGEMVRNRSCLPIPWGVAYSGVSDSVSGLEYDPARKIDTKIWSGPNDAPEMFATSLRTTHGKRVDKRWETRNKNDKVKKKDLPKLISDTTIMDFVYRMRIRSNYNDVDPYLTNVRERQHVEEISSDVDCFYSASMVLGEALIAKSVGVEKYAALVSRYVNWVGAHNASEVIKRRRLIKEFLSKRN